MSAKRRGLTVVELILALMVTSLIALAAAGVTGALSTAHAQSQTTYENLRTLRSGISQIQHNLSRAKLVVSIDAKSVVCWMQDFNGDGKINLSELAQLRYDSQNRQVQWRRVVFPDNMDAGIRAALDSPVTLNSASDSSTVDDLIGNDIRHEVKILAEDIQEFRVRARPLPPMTKLVAITLVAGDGSQSFTIQSSASIRADRTADVAVSQNQYILSPSAYSVASGEAEQGGF